MAKTYTKTAKDIAHKNEIRKLKTQILHLQQNNISLQAELDSTKEEFTCRLKEEQEKNEALQKLLGINSEDIAQYMKDEHTKTTNVQMFSDLLSQSGLF